MATAPRLTVRAIRAVAVEVPMTYVLGTSRGAFTKAPLILIDLETEEGDHRPLLSVVLRARDHAGDRERAGGGGGDGQRRPCRAARSVEQARRSALR